MRKAALMVMLFFVCMAWGLAPAWAASPKEWQREAEHLLVIKLKGAESIALLRVKICDKTAPEDQAECNQVYDLIKHFRLREAEVIRGWLKIVRTPTTDWAKRINEFYPTSRFNRIDRATTALADSMPDRFPPVVRQEAQAR